VSEGPSPPSPLASELLHFFETHLLDVDNCLIGQLVANGTDVLHSAETHTRRQAELALDAAKLIDEIRSWQSCDDESVLLKVCSSLERCFFQIVFCLFVVVVVVVVVVVYKLVV
jgi:hypothetical protein